MHNPKTKNRRAPWVRKKSFPDLRKSIRSFSFLPDCTAIEQIRQGFDKKELYPTFEEKAATLLYLIVKNHAFVDGNKRIAAACFLLFLEKNNRLGPGENLTISNEALASLTVFVAVSKPHEMETVKQLIISILNRNKP